jgi:hypothetical protein
MGCSLQVMPPQITKVLLIGKLLYHGAVDRQGCYLALLRRTCKMKIGTCGWLLHLPMVGI